ncbi:3-phosphoshikimate 1-carboxyvinyltransferase [Cytophagaceae bacterium YF14B1]|uniref:3-phosphoshikimate 1-carboxyvinyltransferase n=1 Tax=Xanthocytophaga flava TaxID=3048013 RepID=A0AAE3QVU8_9BACT|nr:3-phosphoshikimate 1-carboxyvinyltransferase [Xanthocytophaga flavus]MDJ1483729.1 3-phosphoshikimate 1-carboxyvinyltransferase [Xanthocytophaga flavus]
MDFIRLHHPTGKINTTIQLASSKSESNRSLVINALSGGKGTLTNLSEARDTQTMQRLLASNDQIWDVLDAGTTMRFLTAYATITNQEKIMTGTARMCERPIGLLVDALRVLGATIDYVKQEGYPPIHIKGFQFSGKSHIQIRGDVSSQYISALLMIAPLLPEGLQLELTGVIGSRPYIEMTLRQMETFGVQHEWNGNIIRVKPQTYQPTSYQVESDWSGASYWYSIVALAEEAEIELLGLKENSLQGDSRIAEIMVPLGVTSTFTKRGVLLKKITAQPSIVVDFSDCPDLAQTVAVCCAAKGIEAEFTGIESLKIKETDRVKAIQNELGKFNGELIEVESNYKYKIPKPVLLDNHTPVRIHTYDDHRMAMAFAPLALQRETVIEHPNVVVKSYPGFWDDLRKAGFVIS